MGYKKSKQPARSTSTKQRDCCTSAKATKRGHLCAVRHHRPAIGFVRGALEAAGQQKAACPM